MEKRINTNILRKRMISAGMNLKVCANCGADSELVIHHIVPLALGGSNRTSNLVCLCTSCHSLMHSGIKISDLNKPRRKPAGRKRGVDEIGDYKTIRYLADKHSMSQKNISNAIKAGRLKANKINGQMYIAEKDFLFWQENKWVKGWHMQEA